MIESAKNIEMVEASDVKKMEKGNYMKIKPVGDINISDARSYFDNLFQKLYGKELVDNGTSNNGENNFTNERNCDIKLEKESLNPREQGVTQNLCQEKAETKRCYYDDNGKLYRVEKDLEPNIQYEINGYSYTTDEQGRIVSAEGNLHIKQHEGRLAIKDSIEDIGKGDQEEGDDRGHLIGDQFDGSNGLENMIPQDSTVNRNDFKNFENELAKEVKDGKEVYVSVEPVYEGDSRRPKAIVVTYSINGQENIRVFPNGGE